MVGHLRVKGDPRGGGPRIPLSRLGPPRGRRGTREGAPTAIVRSDRPVRARIRANGLGDPRQEGFKGCRVAARHGRRFRAFRL